MTVIEVADALGVSKATVYRAIKDRKGVGEHFFYKPGSGYFFAGTKEDLNKNG